jgi:hypothetical protein
MCRAARIRPSGGQVERRGQGRKFMAVRSTVPQWAPEWLFCMTRLVLSRGERLSSSASWRRTARSPSPGDEEGRSASLWSAPWPNTLTYSTAVSPWPSSPRPQTRWYSRKTVEIFRLEGARRGKQTSRPWSWRASRTRRPVGRPSDGPLCWRRWRTSGDLRRSLGRFVGPEFLSNDPAPPIGDVDVRVGRRSRANKQSNPQGSGQRWGLLRR